MILALIGVGRWGKNIIQTLETIPEIKLKYLCANSVDSLASYSNKYEKFTDWHALLEHKDIDGVIIATPPSTHALIVSAFIERGLPVLVEKPMVLSVEEAEKLRAILVGRNQIFMVGYQYLYNSYIHYLKKEIERGFLGKVLEVRSEHRVSPPRPDVDILWDAGPHPLSIFQYFFKPLKILSAVGNIGHDSVSVKLEFVDAPQLQMLASCSGSIKTRKLTIVGKKGEAVLDETLEKNKLAIKKDSQIVYPTINQTPPLKNELEHFIHCIRTRTTPLTDINFGCEITKWLETITPSLSPQ